MEFRASHILVKDQGKAEEIYNRVKIVDVSLKEGLTVRRLCD